MNEDRIRHDQMANNVVGWVLAAAFAACCWWTLALPIWIPAVINPVLVVAVAYGLARWKRSRFGWVMFWVLLAIQVVGFGADVLSGFTETAPSVLAGAAVLALVVWLVRLPHFHAAEPHVSHVMHHHVVHGADGAAFPVGAGALPAGFDVTGLPEVAERQAVPGRVLRAIEAPKMRPAARWAAVRDAVRGEPR